MTVKLTILGATGTIGVNTLDVVARHADRFEIFALTANANVEGLFEQCQTWNPRYAVMVQKKRLRNSRRAATPPGSRPKCWPAPRPWSRLPRTPRSTT